MTHPKQTPVDREKAIEAAKASHDMEPMDGWGYFAVAQQSLEDGFHIGADYQAKQDAAEIERLKARVDELEARLEGGERWYLIDGEDSSLCDLEDLNLSLRDYAAQNADDPDYDLEKWIYRTITIDDGGFFAVASDVGSSPRIIETLPPPLLKESDNG